LVDLSVGLAKGVVSKNPLVIASGIPGVRALMAFIREGVGAVTTKTITVEPRRGHPPPSIVRLPYGYINAVGLRNPGIDVFLEELPGLVRVAREHDSYVIVSIAGKSIKEYVELASRLEENGVRTLGQGIPSYNNHYITNILRAP